MTEERAAESHEDKFVDMEEPESEANDKSDDNGKQEPIQAPLGLQACSNLGFISMY